MTVHASHFHEHLQKHHGLIRLAVEFEQLTPENHPDQVGRVSLKEEMIVDMAGIVYRNYIPFALLVHTPGHGLKAALLRVIAEHGNTEHIHHVETVANGTQFSSPMNLRWQVIRAYRNLYIRFPGDPHIISSVASTIDVLSEDADVTLLAGLASMKEKLGIA